MFTESGEYMNKFTKGFLSMSLAATVIGAAACGGVNSDSWKSPSLTNHGAIVESSVGGFVAETDNYVYFINGVGSSSSDNTFGKPIKGALVCADKSDLTKTEVIVPELLVASDYGAGVYLFGKGEETYAYYGTPNKEKDSSGAIANSEMTFSRTRLDGSKNEKLFTVNTLSTSYRMAEKNGVVYIIYYDADETALVSFNCADKKKTVIAKTDAKINEKNADGEYVSLGEYTFLNSDSSAQVIYSVTVYSEPYYAEKEANTNSYSRETAAYNYLYVYTAGENAKIFKNGKNNSATYKVTNYIDGYVFYTEKPIVGTEKTFGFNAFDIANTVEEKEIVYTANIKTDMKINDFDEVYYFDSDAGKIFKTVLTNENGTEYEQKEAIVKTSSISSILFVNGNYVFATNSEGYIIALERGEDNRTIRISERTASSSWYAPEIITVGGEDYILYCDSSSEGNSYIYYSELKDLNEPAEKDSDNDGETDVYYLESKFIGVMPAADRAAVVTAKINEIESTLNIVKDENGAPDYCESVNAARAAYNALDEDAKKSLPEASLTKLINAETAVAFSKECYKLKVVMNFDLLSDSEIILLRSNFHAAKLIKVESGDNFDAVSTYVENNLKYYYQLTEEKLADYQDKTISEN